MARDDRRQRAEDRSAAPDLHRRAWPGLRAHRPALVDVASWKLTARAGARVERERFETLDHALAALEARATELADAATAQPEATKLRRYGPEEQVVGRFELAGPERRLPSAHAGLDVHGDGSIEAYTGRVRKRRLDAAPGEDWVCVIHRALSETARREA